MTTLTEAGFLEWEAQVIRQACPINGPRCGIVTFEELVRFWDQNGQRRAFLNSRDVSMRMIDRIEAVIAQAQKGP